MSAVGSVVVCLVDSAVGSPQQGENRSSVSIQKLRETVEALEEENQQVSLLTHQTRQLKTKSLIAEEAGNTREISELS